MENNFHLTAITVLEKEVSELEAKRAQLVAEIDVDIEKLRELIAGHRERVQAGKVAGTALALAQPSEEPTRESLEPEIPKNAFKSLTIIAGVKKYLKMAQVGKSTREIAEALVKGGKRKTADKYLLDTIRTALRRRAEKNGIVRIDSLWWLAEWPHTPQPHEGGQADDDFSEEETVPERSTRSEVPAPVDTLAVGSRAATAHAPLTAFDEAGKPMSKAQRIKSIVPLMEGDEVSQPLVITKVRELYPDLAYIDPTIVTKALRELEKDGVLVQVRPRRAKHPAVFRKV
jgi:hypothetical protein